MKARDYFSLEKSNSFLILIHSITAFELASSFRHVEKMSNSNASSQHILITYSEYERLKNIEEQFDTLQKAQHQKLQIPSTYYSIKFLVFCKKIISNFRIFFKFQVRNLVKDLRLILI